MYTLYGVYTFNKNVYTFNLLNVYPKLSTGHFITIKNSSRSLLLYRREWTVVYQPIALPS